MYTLLYRLLCLSCWFFSVDAESCRKARPQDRRMPVATPGRESFGH